MTAVQCSPDPTRKSVLTISWEDEPWRHVHTSIFGRKPSLPQLCLTIEEFEQEFAKIEYRLAKLYAYRRLAAMNMLSLTLAKSLRTRFVSAEITERIIQEFLDLGYLNDEEWTKSFVRVQTRRKMGPRAIAAKLAAKGVSSDLFEEYTQDAPEEKDQRTLIQELLKTKYRKRNLEDFKERQKVVAALVRRGFEVSEILDTIKAKDES